MDSTTPITASLPSLLGPKDPPAYEVVNPNGGSPFLLMCCHAGQAIPRELGDLGLDGEARARHIGWDIGARDITLGLSEALDAPAVLGTYSRLVVDLNRLPGTADSIPETSDATAIPGNRGLEETARARRIRSVFWPFHNAMSDTYDTRLKRGAAILVDVHTFTPRMNGGNLRPWEAGILWNRDPRLAMPMLRFLREEAGFNVGDNQPYSGREYGFSVNYHAGDAGHPHV
ncbi:MAG: N-formylglutamate amidohydrolase, partial [Rhodospirillales bacterium]|nr:N-formylglutamate amidohydrolase [Rhodospirillales bacterium]